MKLLFTTLTICILLGNTSLLAQLQIAAGPSVKNYYGDIASDISIGAEATIEWKPSTGLGLFGRGQLGGISGTRNQNDGDYSFQSAITAFTAGVNLYPVGLLNGGTFTTLQPFVNGQAGFMSYEVTDIVQPADGLGMMASGNKMLLGFGGGMDIHFSKSIGTRLSANYSIPGTDEIDGWYPTVASNVADDFFATFGISLLYRPGQKAKPEASPAVPDLGEEDQSWLPRPTEQEQPAPADEVPQPSIEDTPQPEEVTTPEVVPSNSPEPESAADPSPTATNEPENLPADASTSAVSTNRQSINDTPVVAAAPSTTTVSDESETTKSVEEENSILEATVFNINGSKGNRKYYVIGASFQTLPKAQEFQFQMAEKGYSTIIITDVDKTRYRISFGSFNDKQDAEQLAGKLRTDYNPDTWIIQNGQ